MSRPSPPSKRLRRSTLQARCEVLEDRPLMNVQFTIDPLQDVKPISRYIYGINQQLPGYSNFTLQRLGGNLTSAWNWVTGNSNAGRDYYYQNESLSYFTGGTTGPGGAAIPALQADKAQDAATLLTVPINGYVAANEADDSVLNDSVTTVATAVSASATVIPVANAAAIPTTPYYIVVRGEEMEVTGVDLAHNQLTVVRGISGGNVALKANDSVYLAPDVRNAGASYLQTQFEQELPTKPGGPGSFTLTPDPNSKTVYADEFVNWVNKTFPNGQTNPNTPIWYELDNEPDIWNSTHTELQPNAVTYAQLLQESLAYAKAIKSVAPNTMVFGPVSYGWEGFVSLQNAPDASGRNWLEYYLQQMQQASAASGQRLLDTLDVHFYTSTPDDPASTVQATRSLWDPSYMENSWIAQSIPGAIDLLPRLQADINTYYPGTKLAISEYNYGSGNNIFGAIAQADALGIFGVQGLYAATEWQLSSDESYIGAAFNMFRNFDGKSGTFGDNSVLASTNDVNDSSIYASVDSANSNMMTLVAINKSTQALPATMHLDHVQPGATAAIYQLTAGSTTPQYVGTVTITDPSNFTYTMPGSSITTIRILSPGAPANAPTVATAAHASPSSVTGVSTSLGAVGTDTNGESSLTYTWSTTAAPAPVGFSINGTNASKNTVATFTAPGSYSFLVTITNGGGYFATSRVNVTVNATLAHITVRPSQTTTAANGMQQFTATGTDQFGNPLAAQPSVAWSTTAGSISTAGIYSAPATAGNVTINASAAGVQGSTSITVVTPTSIVVSAATDSALRNAIATANADGANGTSVTILFAPGLAGDTITVGPVPLELKSGTGAVRIEGGNLITLSGGGNAQVFKIDAGAHVTLDGLTITKGAAGAGSGGGIDNAGTLDLLDSSLVSNNAGSAGGAIENSGTLIVTNVVFTGNTGGTSGGAVNSEQGSTLSITSAIFTGNSSATGGALNSAGTAMVIDCSFRGNKASGGDAATGGAINNAGTMTLVNATVANNSAAVAGGGIGNTGSMTVIGSTIENNTGSYIAGGINNLGNMTVANTTIAGNYAYLGGGIYNGNYYGLSGNLSLTNDTITGNFADYGAGGGIYMANGTYSSTGPSTLAMFNTLVAGNFASGNDNDPLSNPNSPFGPDINVYSGTVTGANNLIGIGQGLTGISNGDANHNRVGTPSAPIDPLLVPPIANPTLSGDVTALIAGFNQAQIPLLNNGGTTQTIALQSSSPAIGGAGAITVINGAVGSTSTAIPVTNAAAIASTPGHYFIFVDGEEMEVTDVNLTTNVLTVTRAINGVNATLHATDPVYLDVDQRGFTRPVPGDIGAYQTSVASTSGPSVTSISPSSGTTAGGTQVTITGTDLAGATAVYFGANPATIYSDSLTQIVVINPAGSVGTVDVTVTTPSGTSAKTSADHFTYVAVTSPIVVTTAADDLVHGGISLRDAIVQANLDAGHGTSDTITFSPSLNGGTITLAQGAAGKLVLSGQGAVITIAGAGKITISGGNQTGIFQVNTGVKAALTGLTLTNGNVGSNADGGAINNAGTLMLLNDTFSNNSGKTGGGINNTGVLTVMNSTLTKNSGTVGGAISNSSGGQATVAGCTLTQNTSSYIGGAINNQAVMAVLNSTFAGNGSYLGGAINNGNQYGNGGTLALTNDTLTGNTVTGNGGGVYMENGGYDPKPTTLTVRNCIIAGNTSDQPGPDLFVSNGTLTGAYNLIGIGTGVTGISNNTNGNQIGTSTNPLKPLLAALANNGGPTQTMALQPGSPAIAAGAAVTTISAAVPNATSTSITVANGNRIAVTSPPVGAGYVLVLNGESMLVTAVSGNTLTVQRGYKGTKATSHAAGAAVFLGADQRGAIAPTTFPDLGAFQTTTHLVVTKNPMNLTADAGQTVTFNAAARGGNLNVQWQTSTDGGKSWTNIVGATTKNVVTINGLPTTTTALSRSTTLTLNGREYRVTFANSAGSIISGPAKLTVNPALAVGNLTRNQWTVNVTGFNGNATITGGTGPYTIKSSTGLPGGLVPAVKGKMLSFTGTPTKAGVFKGTITIADATGASFAKLVTITINPAVKLGPLSLPHYSLNALYNQTVSASGGTGPVTLTYTLTGQLPAGLTITPKSPATHAIAIRGTAKAKANVKINITATDTLGSKTSSIYTLTS